MKTAMKALTRGTRVVRRSQQRQHTVIGTVTGINEIDSRVYVTWDRTHAKQLKPREQWMDAERVMEVRS